MPKRKKLSNDDASDDGKRRRKMDLSDVLQEIYDTIRNFKTSDGRLLCEAFIRAPKRRSLADYYEIVTTPMDLIRVQQKIKMDEYDDIEQMSADMELLINNAKSYYKKGSQEYVDACALFELYNETKSDVFSEGTKTEFDEMSNASHGAQDMDSLSNCGSESAQEYDSPYEELFSAVMTAIADDGRSLTTMFELLPSKINYPDYYDIVSDPIDLKTIGTKIQNNAYQSLNELEKDLLLMVKNAKTYNEPGSTIYKDAVTLRRIIIAKKVDIEQRKVQPIKTSERIRAKRLLPMGQKWSAITAALKYESEMESESIANVSFSDETINDEGNFSDPEDADTNPQWQLFEAVRSITNAQGAKLSDPFMRLPSRRFYPDYYREIKNPTSLAKVRARIKTGYYDDTSRLVDDLNLTFENAKKYNRPDSKIFKDACKLQKLMKLKAQDLLNIKYKDLKDSDESDSEGDDSKSGSMGKRAKSRKSLLSAMTHELKKARRSQQDVDSQLKKRMRSLFKALIEFSDETGRTLIHLFMEKPSKKLYPDYYSIIENPIDMKTIEANIKWERYLTEEALINDFRLMFANCKKYNEDLSQIYKDAVTLENVLMEKIKELGPFQPVKQKRPKGPRTSNVIQNKIRTLYKTVKEYVDSKGRMLSTIFMKLPSKTELPEYYEIIKRPIDLEKIGVRVKNNVYDSLEDILADFILMLDNACKFNESDSQIFKDALTLQQIALQSKVELADENGTGVPDIRALIQELLTNLFISVYNHQDEEGRCFSDSIIELSEVDAKQNEQNENKPLNLDIIKRNLDKGKYRRLDRFQQDMFEVFERARRVSRTDSQAFEDSIELQTYFIRLRNDLCKNGELLQSLALQYNEEKLNASIDAMRREKIPKEQELEEEIKPEEKPDEHVISGASLDGINNYVSFDGLTHNIGDFVYIEPREKTMEPHIIQIQKFYKDESGEIWIYGCWFFRPYETFHIASKKFLEKEVFKSDSYNSTPLSQIVGKCFVMFVKDYFRSMPEGYDEKDVYVCESRYFTRAKSFKKIKVWPMMQFPPLILRENPLPMIRVPSVFKDQTEKPRDDHEEEEDKGPKVWDIERPNVMCEAPEGFTDDASIFYEQFSIPSGSYKLGDCCYVRTDQGRNLICRIDRMWVDKEGNAFFHGPWFVQQQELPPLTSKMFYPQEVFLSSIEDTNPLLSICDRCAVVEYKDFIVKRPTEILEKDVYICESRYLEHEKKFVKLSKGLQKFIFLNPNVVEDEIYFLRKPLALQKSESTIGTPVIAKKGQNVESSPLNVPRISIEGENEESNDRLSLHGTDLHVVSTPVATVKKKIAKRLVTGYIVFASEVRKSVVQANPECSFGDVSRIIGTEWKTLPPPQKGEYEQRAQKQNEESAKEAAAAAAAAESLPHSPASAHGNHIENAVYECHWENKCDFQFEDSSDLLDHLVSEPNGHVWQTFGEIKDKEGTEFQCVFHGCGRVKKGAAPFPSLQRLIRHCKEVHVTKQNPKSIAPENRKANFVPSRKHVTSPSTSSSNHSVTYQHTAPQMTINTALLQSRSSPSPALSISDNTNSMSALHPTLSQAIGINNNQSSNMPVLSPFWASGTGVQVKPVEPIFAPTPPRTNRLLHSHAFMKYIERLRPECRHISNWDTQLYATPENTPPQDPNRLPSSWLGNGAGNHGSVVNALWALRNFMMRDAFNISMNNNI